MSTESGAPAKTLTLVAMTLASSMILIDQTAVPLAIPSLILGLGGKISEAPWIMTANIIPLAALMVLGGRLGDLFGLRRVFIIGAVLFISSSALVGFAQDAVWAIAARAAQGTGAALMMPNALAIVSTVYAGPERGRALGLLAGASAFFAACGPILGGVLTSFDWRFVFLVNIPLAIITLLLTLRSVPPLPPDPEVSRKIDFAGAITFGIAMGLGVFGLNQAAGEGDWGQPEVLIALGLTVLTAIAFVIIERRSSNPLIEFRLFRHRNFLAANLSQILAGMVELGMGFLLPAYLLLVIGVDPLIAGLMLIPSTLPIILAGPLAGRAFDRMGGRGPLVFGFLVLAASGAALGLAAPQESFPALIPGLILQGIGLGVVLTVNDPTGLGAVSEREQGQGAGVINTTEQMGGALGIAVLSSVLLSIYIHKIERGLAELGDKLTPGLIAKGRDYILKVGQQGRDNVDATGFLGKVDPYIISFHAQAYEVTFFVAGGLALTGALICLLLVRREDRMIGGPKVTRRSRYSAIAGADQADLPESS